MLPRAGLPSIHEERDQELLLLAHGALGMVARLRLQIHLVRCARCRQRLAEFQGVSHLLAATVRGSGVSRWNPPAALSLRVHPGWLILGLTLLLLMIFGTTALVMRSHAPSPASHRPCRPDLPNDHCR